MHVQFVQKKISPFDVLTLLVGQQEGHLACKKLGADLLVVMIWLEIFSSFSSSCQYHLHHHTSLAAMKSRVWVLN